MKRWACTKQTKKAKSNIVSLSLSYVCHFWPPGGRTSSSALVLKLINAVQWQLNMNLYMQLLVEFQFSIKHVTWNQNNTTKRNALIAFLCLRNLKFAELLADLIIKYERFLVAIFTLHKPANKLFIACKN